MTGVALPCSYRGLKIGVVGSGAGLCQALQQLQRLQVPIVAVATHRSAQEEAESQELDAYRRLGWYHNLDGMAKRLGVSFVRTPDLNMEGCVRDLRACGVNLVLSVSAQVLRPAFLQAFSGFVFNIHGSAVYRGRAGLTWAILNNLSADRVVLHWVASAIDAGHVVADHPYEWPSRSYPIDIMQAQYQAYGPLLVEFAAILRAGRIPRGDPGNERKLYFPLIRGERDGAIQWGWAPDAVDAFVRAFGWPYIGAYSHFRDSRGMSARVHIARCEVLQAEPGSFHPFCNGVPVRYGPGDGVDIIVGGSLLRLLTVRNGWDEAPARSVVRLGGRFVPSPEPAPSTATRPSAVHAGHEAANLDRHLEEDMAGVGGRPPHG